MPVLLIFIDGLGVGTRGKHNPLDRSGLEFLSIFQDEEVRLPHDGRLALTDTTLGVDGLPQSATGQTTILTGINAAKLIGRHLNGYPSPRLKAVLAENSIYKQLQSRGRSVAFANAYSPPYFENKPRFQSATTVAAESAGLILKTLEDLEVGQAVCHDFTNQLLVERGYKVTTCTPEAAGQRLASFAPSCDFVLYEHFITDRLGHDRDFERAGVHLERLNRFVGSVSLHHRSSLPATMEISRI
jgi:hypothetical protein